MRKTILCLTLSILLVIALVPQISFAAAGDVASADSNAGAENIAAKVITAFAELETSDYWYEGNPEEDELTLNLPENLSVYLNGNSEATEIPVSWEAVEDYDKTDFYFYSMKPVWGSEYTLDPALSPISDVPWITVYKQEPENDEVEPIRTEDEIEPVYTEEEGPVDPEATDPEKIIEDTAEILTTAFAEEVYAATTKENTEAIYKYLTKTMGLNTAAACGVMVNICAESGMSPINLQNTYNKSLGLDDDEYTERVDKGKGAYKTKSGTKKNFKSDTAGYGLCQWTSLGRKTNLLDAALENETSVGDINTQMAFLAKELESGYPQVLATLKKVPNTATGAYAAAAEFCLVFEAPANTVSTAASRAKTCLSGYWKTYSGKSASVTGTSYLSLCGYAYPTVVRSGKGMTLKGYVVSNYKITSVTAKITDTSGKVLYSQTKKPGVTAYTLNNLDSALKFAKLSAGKYKYVVTATDSSEKSMTVTHTFKVATSGSTETEFGFAKASTGTSSETASQETENATDTTKEDTKETADTKSTYKGTYPTLPKRGYFKKGDKGKQVVYLQKYLNWAGYKVTTGGTYGAKTIAAVKKFQKANGLKQDGQFGKSCLKKAKTIKK